MHFKMFSLTRYVAWVASRIGRGQVLAFLMFGAMSNPELPLVGFLLLFG